MVKILILDKYGGSCGALKPWLHMHQFFSFEVLSEASEVEKPRLRKSDIMCMLILSDFLKRGFS